LEGVNGVEYAEFSQGAVDFLDANFSEIDPGSLDVERQSEKSLLKLLSIEIDNNEFRGFLDGRAKHP